jgi:hypothetical protein
MPGEIFFPRRSAKKAPGKHEDGNIFGVVYANALANDALKAAGEKHFPVGSIIVREKLAKADDVQPQLLTAMIKRARGFNRKANDWEFLAIDGTISRILEQQKQGSCVECHASQKKRDFVFPLPAQ